MDSKNFKSFFKDAIRFVPEWLIIAFWALWIGRAYLDMGLNMWPNNGQEYIMSMQNQYVWPLLLKCGACLFWNGFTNGGSPSFVDILSGWLHPISIISTFLYGVFNSGKVIIIASLMMAGMGQWWLGKVLKLNALTRTWTAMIFVASGAMVGRMEIGSPPLVQGMAACSLVFPAALELALRGGKRATLVLGITLGLAALAGQAYPQIGLIICLVPMVVVLLAEIKADGFLRIKPEWRNYIFASILGAMIAAPLLVTLIHYSPVIGKDTDPTFGSAQPLKFIALNLVIDDAGFYNTDVLGKQPFPHLNVNYIGWVPVIFAILGLSLVPRKMRREKLGICVAIGFVYLTSSAVLLKWINLLPLGDLITGIRGMGQIQGLAGLLILALAGMGVEELIQKDWPRATFSLLKTNQKLGSLNLSAKWIVLVIAMILALKSVADFSKNYLYVTSIDLDTNSLIQPLKTPDAQWVQPPWGDYVWLPSAIENGMKIRDFFRPWRINGPEMPREYLQMSTIQEDANLPEYIKSYGDYVILKRPENLYASIKEGENTTACQATSIGGFINVSCDTISPGRLSVIERALSGWTVTRDGQKVSMMSNSWLTVDAPAGKHNYAFRYRPWDAPVGIGLSIVGWIIAVLGLTNLRMAFPVPIPSFLHLPRSDH